MRGRILLWSLVAFIQVNSEASIRHSMLDWGKPWLRAPEAHFETELVEWASMVQISEEQKYPDHELNSEAAEVRDLETALAKGGLVSADETSAQWRQLRQRIVKLRNFTESEDPDNDQVASQATELQEILSGVDLMGAKGVPTEFILYLKGAAQWRAGDSGSARLFWNEVLELPIADRSFRSSWAAYMLARASLAGPTAQAHETLAVAERVIAAGFSDPLNLAGEISGWKAQLLLRDKNYAKAMDLYLERRAVESLRRTAEKALANASGDELKILSGNEMCRKVITAFLISNGAEGSHARKWFEAVKLTGAATPELAERMALAAYRADDLDSAQYWIEGVGESPVARWVQAKIHLQRDEIDEALAILRRLGRELKEESISSELFSNLTINNMSADRRILAELGAVELHTGNFVPALTAFMKAQYWPDAAFIAERILTIEELKTFVDQWKLDEADDEEEGIDGRLRALLARRYMQVNQIAKARAYFPETTQTIYDEFVGDLKVGLDSSAPSDARAKSLFNAAVLTRMRGDELFGTELEPDWVMKYGSTGSLTGENRIAKEKDQLPPTKAEIERIKSSALPFSNRFRYRYIAADLGWMASLLMPNEDDETARVLCQAGTWIKNLDPKMADRFYKSLVRRCGHTDLGAKADKKRWFPSMDETQIDTTTPR